MDRPAIATMTTGKKVGGRLTTDHPASSYGQPVFVADGGTAINWVDIMDIDTAAPERARGGKARSDAKRAAAAANGQRGGRPREWKKEIASMTKLNYADLDDSLKTDIASGEIEPGGYEIYEADPPTKTVSNQALHIVYCTQTKRGGVVFVGSGADGETHWTDAVSAEDVLKRYLSNDMRN